MMFGFVTFHLGEKFVYQHIKHKKEMMKDLAFIHISGFFVYHFVLGILLYISFNTGITEIGLFTFALLLTHVFSSSISLTHIDEFLGMHKLSMIALASAPVAGVFLASVLEKSLNIHYPLFAFVVGAVLYIVTRDMIPAKEEGNSKLFFAGFILSLGVILVSKIL